MTDGDWEHSLGGLHAVVLDDGELVGHASVIQRRLLHGGRALRAGYVEGVAVRADRRRRGHASAVLDVLEGVLRRAYEVGGLAAGEPAASLYAARGWVRWRGPTHALTPAGVVRTQQDDGGVHVFRVTAPLDFGAALTCDWRGGDVW